MRRLGKYSYEIIHNPVKAGIRLRVFVFVFVVALIFIFFQGR